MMTFWDTVRGVAFADTLIRELPKLTAKKEQVLITLNSKANEAKMSNLFMDGYQYKDSFVNSEGVTVVVLEKEVD